MFTGDLCGVPSQFFRHVSSAFVDSLGYFAQAFSRIYPCFDLYSIRQCHSTHVSLLSAGCDRNYYTAYCRGERHPITTFLPLKCYLHFCNQPCFWIYNSILGVPNNGLSSIFIPFVFEKRPILWRPQIRWHDCTLRAKKIPLIFYLLLGSNHWENGSTIPNDAKSILAANRAFLRPWKGRIGKPISIFACL